MLWWFQRIKIIKSGCARECRINTVGIFRFESLKYASVVMTLRNKEISYVYNQLNFF